MKVASEKKTMMNQSSIKVLDIIDYIAFNDNEPLRLQDIAEGLSMNASTALRFLSALVEAGYAIKNPDTLRYSLSFRLCYIANNISSNIQLYEIALPEMKEISSVFEESVYLSIEQDMSVVYIGILNGPDKLLNTMQRIGNIAPLHCAASGKLMLLNHDEGYIDKLIDMKGLISFTPNTITTKKSLLNELDKVRENGYSIDNEECEVGARGIALPIMDYTQKPIAYISVTGTIFRMTDKKIQQNLAFLKKQASILSLKLGYIKEE